MAKMGGYRWRLAAMEALTLLRNGQELFNIGAMA
jgi:hypothetical protein